MPRFAVDVTERNPAPAHADRAQFEVSVTERDPRAWPSNRAHKCKCKCKCECIPAVPGPWSRVAAEPPDAAAAPRFTELSPLGD